MMPQFANMGAVAGAGMTGYAPHGGAGASAGRGGGAGTRECYYGRGCSRKNCIYRHSQGRDIDAHAAGAGAGGGAGAEDAAMAMMMEEAEAVLMAAGSARSTFLPSSRDCTCCHGMVYACSRSECRCVTHHV